ncbi:MAG TPA: ClbS/DfsB family four-helix bundle protein [Anaerolineales bacterium]|jgi:hypothetical protein|nr:ClbS/DfsB family four-helix bundle protein [Anaerolineales bacterium]
MSELPFEIPQNKQELKQLFVETREKFASTWKGLPDEALNQRPGPNPDWSVKDILAHICWWESFALSRITILAAGEKLHLLSDFDALNRQVFEQYREMPFEQVELMFNANQTQIEGLIDSLSFDEWTDENRPNFKGQSLMRMLGGNTFGHYFEHLDDLLAYQERYR